MPVPSMEVAIFFVCSLIALAGSLGVVMSRNPVHSALSLVATLFAVAILFLNQNAQFLGAVQVIVYTGAIVVLILFVIMLLGVDREEDLTVEPLVAQRPIAMIAGVVLIAGLLTILFVGGAKLVTGEPSANDPIMPTAAPADSGEAIRQQQEIGADNIRQVGAELFSDYVFAFEVTALLLTIAVVGAVLMARRPRDLQPLPKPEAIDDEDLEALSEETA
ncbi:MAG: NADH-quinone oxidoreductase subunit J [Acidimicrobiales bacterium]|nr:NADH-quinone oxidoreductase subunit J [Acidimicrobiales bacterium]